MQNFSMISWSKYNQKNGVNILKPKKLPDLKYL